MPTEKSYTCILLPASATARISGNCATQALSASSPEAAAEKFFTYEYSTVYNRTLLVSTGGFTYAYRNTPRVPVANVVPA